MGVRIEILYDKSPPVFKPGELITGSVFVQTTEPLYISELTIIFQGSSQVDWKEVSTLYIPFVGKVTETSYFRNADIHFLYGRNLLGDREYCDALLPGPHRFPFEFPIPESGLPCSFRDKYGKIQYFSAVELVGIRNGVSRAPFTIVSSLDLNEDYALVHGRKCTIISRKFLIHSGICGIANPSEIEVKFNLKKLGFGPLESIPCEIEFDNKSKKKLKTSLLLLKQYSYTSASGKVKRTNFTILVKVKGPKVRGRKSEYWETEELRIPDNIMPSGLGLGKLPSIIDINYFVELRISAGWMNKNCLIQLPIVIGNIGLKE